MEVLFQTSDGQLHTLGEQAALIAENLRLFGQGKFPQDAELVVQMGAKPDWRDGAVPLANVIEEALVGGRTDPVPVEGQAAEALYWAMRLVTNPSPDLAEFRQELGVLLGYVPGEYWLTFDVLESEARSLEDATDARGDDRIGGVVTQEPSDGTAMVVFQVRATDPDSAWREAEDAYAALRRDAQLPDAPALGGTITPLRAPKAPALSEPADTQAPVVPRPPQPYERLLDTAQKLLIQAEYDYAIVAAQTACELAIAQSMRRLTAKRAPDLRTALEKFIGRDYSLASDRVSGLWRGLASDDITKADFWARYCEHRQLRNRIVHGGDSASESEAKESTKVALEVCEHVTALAPSE